MQEVISLCLVPVAQCGVTLPLTKHRRTQRKSEVPILFNAKRVAYCCFSVDYALDFLSGAS